MANRLTWKTIISYAICLVLLFILIEVTMGITVGVLSGIIIGTDKATQEDISKILQERDIKEIDIPKSIFSDDEWYKNLPPEVQKDLKTVVKRNLQEINWFGVTLFVSAFVFAVVGFLCGFINKDYTLVGFFVVISFLLNNPIVRFPYAKDLGLLQKFIVVAVAQFGICYLFGYLGTLLGRKCPVRPSASPIRL
ncbi:MAG: hypothetical protein HY026_05130 [Deltaproteobacteria bacterium]|nr:hypothetical protein [Deltaproteobacteria bacterium]